MTAAKKIVDYIEKKDEKTVILGGRISEERREQVEVKMKKDGIKTVQDLINAMVGRYLDED